MPSDDTRPYRVQFDIAIAGHQRFPLAAEDHNEAQRAWRWLAGRGFDGAAIRAALRELDDVDDPS